MEGFLSKYKYLLIFLSLILLCLLPTIVFAVILKREFIDLGLLFTAVAFIIFILPINKNLGKYKESRKG